MGFKFRIRVCKKGVCDEHGLMYSDVDSALSFVHHVLAFRDDLDKIIVEKVIE